MKNIKILHFITLIHFFILNSLQENNDFYIFAIPLKKRKSIDKTKLIFLTK